LSAPPRRTRSRGRRRQAEAQDVQQGAQRAASAEARAEDARAETTRAREDAARELERLRAEHPTAIVAAEARAERAAAEAQERIAQVRAGAAHVRDGLRELLDDRGPDTDRGTRRAARQRAEHDLAVRAELAQARQETGAAGTPRRRQGQE
jgi:hypothetical protein